MKKIITILIVFALALTTLSACGQEIDDGPVETAPAGPQEETADGGDGPAAEDPGSAENPDVIVPQVPGLSYDPHDEGFVEDNGIGYIWNQLSDEMKTDTAEIMNAIKNVQLSCSLTYGIADDQSNDFATFIYNSCIDYPYIGTSFAFIDSDGDGTRDRVTIPYNYDVATTEEVAMGFTAELNAKLDEIIAGIPDGLDDWHRALYLHDYLVFHTDYSEDARLPFTAYGAIVEGKATCQGYSDALHLLLARAGFECTYVIGYSHDDSAKHKWNYVKLDDGQWYIIDPTWSDPSGKEDPDYICYDYFMIDDETILLDHLAKFDGLYHDAPVATSMERCYHKVMGYWCENYDEAAASIKEQAKNCVANGTIYIYLRFPDWDTAKSVRDTLADKNSDGYLKNIFKEVNEEIGSDLDGFEIYPGSKYTSPNTIIINFRE